MCVISISNGQILPVFRVKMNNKRRVLSLRSTHVTLVQSTRETGDIDCLATLRCHPQIT